MISSDGFTTWYGGGPIDEHGKVVSRTKSSHPYSYDGFVVHRFGENKEATGTVYSDRMWEWDNKKHDRLRQEHFGDRAQLRWSQDDPKKIEQFLRDYLGYPDLKLILVMEYCNVSNGYPCWRFDYNSGKKPE